MDYDRSPPSPLSTGLRCRCPRCGEGRLFDGFLQTRPRCERCGLDFAFIDSGDGPAFFVTSIVGLVVVFCAMMVEFSYEPPVWLHMALWLPLTVVLSLGAIRPAKGLMISIQYASKAAEGRPQA